MAKKAKYKDVAKFGGVDELGKTSFNNYEHELSNIEAKSETNLEMDKGEGNATIIRCFTFGINPEVFMKQRPTKQDLFNYHISGIEMAMYRDGMIPYLEVEPRITFDTKRMQYSIFVAAHPRKGYLLQERPQTLSEIAHS